MLRVDEDALALGVLREERVAVGGLVVERRDDLADARELRRLEDLKASSAMAGSGLQTSSVPGTPMGKPTSRKLRNEPMPMKGRSRPVR